MESTSKLIINLNAVTIKATMMTLVSFGLRLSSKLMLRIFLLSSVRSCKRGSISEMINYVDAIAENKQRYADHIVNNPSYDFAEKEDAFVRVEVPAKEFMGCR